jgi:hypothetical protein
MYARTNEVLESITFILAYPTVYKFLVGKPEGKRLPRRPRCMWKDVIRMDLREIGWGVVDCI